jgi:pyrimidine operon attenuation protein / uracil phosphoribosyltransferase
MPERHSSPPMQALSGMTELMTADDVGRALRRIAHQILEQHGGVDEVVLAGIKTRGAYLSQRLKRFIDQFEGVDVPCFDLDVTPYRDDRHDATPKKVLPGVMIEGRSVVLVDDVLFTGRTIRAAMDALTAMGRPSKIELAVLVDRGHRELPVRPDYVGKNTPTSRDERVSVHVDEVDGDVGAWIVKTV